MRTCRTNPSSSRSQYFCSHNTKRKSLPLFVSDDRLLSDYTDSTLAYSIFPAQGVQFLHTCTLFVQAFLFPWYFQYRSQYLYPSSLSYPHSLFFPASGKEMLTGIRAVQPAWICHFRLRYTADYGCASSPVFSVLDRISGLFIPGRYRSCHIDIPHRH